MIKKILVVISILILPIVFGFMIYCQITEIKKTKDAFNLNVGKVDSFGVMLRTHKGSYKSPKTESEVFYVKLRNNDTIYSYFSRREAEYIRLSGSIVSDMPVKIYNEGYTKSQNTVDIIQLENNQEILIGKTEYNFNAYVLLVFFSTLLFFYFYIPYKFIYKKSRLKNK